MPVGAIPAHAKVHADLTAVCQMPNPGHELLMYYKRGKFAWLEESDSSSAEEMDDGWKNNCKSTATSTTTTTSTSSTAPSEAKTTTTPAEAKTTATTTEGFCTGSESNYSDTDDKDGDSDGDSDDDSDDDNDNDDNDDDGIVVDLNVSPAGTWENARKLKKVTWFKDPKWCRYMEEVLVGMPAKDWTMKRFLNGLCKKRNVSGYRKVRLFGSGLATGRFVCSYYISPRISGRKNSLNFWITDSSSQSASEGTTQSSSGGHREWTARDFSL